MAKKAAKRDGKSLVIVESPAKARTISKFLGSGYTVEASIGHVRDLPQGAKQIPAEYQGRGLGLPGRQRQPGLRPGLHHSAQARRPRSASSRGCSRTPRTSIWRRTKTAKEKPSVGTCSELLKPKVPVHRLVFHEITKEAIQDALAAPAQHRRRPGQAQEARRIIDRLYGYEVSPLLWRKVRPKLSAGRVQSVAVRLIVERERQRMAFRIGHLLGSAGHVRQAERRAVRRRSWFRSTAARFPPARISIPPPASSRTIRCCCSTSRPRIA